MLTSQALASIRMKKRKGPNLLDFLQHISPPLSREETRKRREILERELEEAQTALNAINFIRQTPVGSYIKVNLQAGE